MQYQTRSFRQAKIVSHLDFFLQHNKLHSHWGRTKRHEIRCKVPTNIKNTTESEQDKHGDKNIYRENILRAENNSRQLKESI